MNKIIFSKQESTEEKGHVQGQRKDEYLRLSFEWMND